MKEEIQFTDRYQATETPYPDENSCDWCEGMGISPIRRSRLNIEAIQAKGGRLMIVGQIGKEKISFEDDDWIFVKCPECCGSRKKEPAEVLEYGGYKWQKILTPPINI